MEKANKYFSNCVNIFLADRQATHNHSVRKTRKTAQQQIVPKWVYYLSSSMAVTGLMEAAVLQQGPWVEGTPWRNPTLIKTMGT